MSAKFIIDIQAAVLATSTSANIAWSEADIAEFSTRALKWTAYTEEDASALTSSLKHALQQWDAIAPSSPFWPKLCFALASALCRCLTASKNLCKGFRNLQFIFARCSKAEPVRFRLNVKSRPFINEFFHFTCASGHVLHSIAD